MKKHVLKYYVSIESFALLLDVDPALIRRAIQLGAVHVYLIGMNQYEMIDMRKYIDFNFNAAKPVKRAIWWKRWLGRNCAKPGCSEKQQT